MHQQCMHSKDAHGPYVAWRLGNRNLSLFYGWYVLISPEDLPLMENYNWCGNRTNNGIEVRRRETVGGKTYTVLLNRAIWERMHPDDADHYGNVYRQGHPLDFRRMMLSVNWLTTLRGVVANSGGWQVQITIGNKTKYIGYAATKEDGYRMFNRYLRYLKKKHPQDHKIQSIPYNEIAPPF